MNSSVKGKTCLYKDTLDSLEKELIIDALKSETGNMTKAAEFLGITERMMGIRVKKIFLSSGSI